MVVAPAHLDAHRAGAAPAAGARSDPRLGDPPGEHRLPRGVAVARRPPAARADLGPPRPVLGLRLGVVRRDLHPADDLAGGLHHPAPVRLLPRDARQAPEGAAPPLAPAGEHVVHHRRGPRRRAGPCRARDEGAALPRPLRRGRVRRGRRRARLPPRGRQPGLPPRRDRRARGRRRRQPVRLQGRRHPAQRHGLRLLQQPDAVRRLRPGRALRPRRDGAVLLQHHRLRRRLAHRGQAGRDGARVRRRSSTTRPSRAARTRRTTSRSTTRCRSAAPTSSSSVTATRR